MKRWLASYIYLILKQYISVESYTNLCNLSIHFRINIFGETIKELIVTQKELVEIDYKKL